MGLIYKTICGLAGLGLMLGTCGCKEKEPSKQDIQPQEAVASYSDNSNDFKVQPQERVETTKQEKPTCKKSETVELTYQEGREKLGDEGDDIRYVENVCFGVSHDAFLMPPATESQLNACLKKYGAKKFLSAMEAYRKAFSEDYNWGVYQGMLTGFRDGNNFAHMSQDP